MKAGISLVVLLALLLPPGGAEARTFKIATAAPDSLEFMRKVRAAVRLIEEETEGRVKFKIYPGGVQGDDQTVLRKIRVGQLHGGMVAAGALSGFYPDLQVYNLPLGFRSFEEVDYVRERLDPIIVGGLEDAGVVTFGLIETGFAYILSNAPVRSLTDIRTIKGWAPDDESMTQNLFRAFGITPIPLNLGDVLAGLQTGLIDAIAAPPVVVIAMQWHTRTRFLTDMPLMYIYSMLMLDAEAFGRIDPTDQTLVRGALNRVFAEIGAGNREDNREAFAVLVEQGIEVVRPNEAELAAWRARALESVDAVVASGALSPEIVSRFQNHLTEFRAQAERASIESE